MSAKPHFYCAGASLFLVGSYKRTTANQQSGAYRRGAEGKINPLNWKREHQIAFLVAVIFGACIGIFAGVQQIEPSTDLYWLSVALWGTAGAVMAAVGAFIRQMFRDRASK